MRPDPPAAATLAGTYYCISILVVVFVAAVVLVFILIISHITIAIVHQALKNFKPF